MKGPVPTGECWCGCGAETSRGSFFQPGHDRIAETAVVQTRYGGVPEFLLHHGFGPGALNPKAELERHRALQRALKPPADRQPEKTSGWTPGAAKIWPLLVDLARRHREMTYKELGSVVGIFHRNLRLPLDLIAKHCLSKKLPMLTVLIVNADTRMPGTGFLGSQHDLDKQRVAVFEFDWAKVKNPFIDSEQ